MAKKAKAATKEKESLKPYLSVALARAADDQLTDEQLLGEVMVAAALLIGARDGRTPIETRDTEAIEGLSIQAHIYRHHRRSPWANDEIYDDTHELLVIGVKQGTIAISCSESSIRDMLIDKLDMLTAFPRDILEQAFVGSSASAIWLSGIHPQTASKATSKAMLGPALEYALDPLGDQSFAYSAIRSIVHVAGSASSVGAAPGSARIWTSRKPWTQFAGELGKLLDKANAALVTAPPLMGWLKMLARRSGDITAAKDPYAIAIVPPELLQDSDTTGERRQDLIDWAYQSEFEMIGDDQFRPIARVSLKGDVIGELKLDFEVKSDKFVATPIWQSNVDGFEESRSKCELLVTRPECLRVYYDTFTLADGALFHPAYRDQRFDWEFADFAGYSVKDEKPKTWGGKQLAEVIAKPKQDGSGDDSLFAYVVEKLYPKGWVASDDGAMEFADFIHLDPDTHKVTLIHVKAVHAKKGQLPKPDREVSVSEYEVVVGQAVKNIRHLDRSTLVQVLEGGKDKAIARAVWFDGKEQKNRIGLIAAAKKVKPDHEKEVIVLQPQLTKKEHEACTTEPPTSGKNRVKRMKQLDTLMLSARLSCMAVGASFKGIGAK